MAESFPFLPGLLFGEKKSDEEKEQTEPENGLVITIAREYGSGGHDIGKALAKELGIPFYDRSIIDMKQQRKAAFPEIL